MLSLLDILFCLEIAITGCVFSLVLTEEDKIFEFYGDFLNWLIYKGYLPLANALGACEKCFSGQLALWIWLFLILEEYKENFMHALISHILFISITIFLSIPITQYINDEKERRKRGAGGA